MSDFDLVLAGQVVLPDRCLTRGYVAVREGRIAGEFHHPFDPDALIDAMFAESQEGSHD